MLAYKPRLLSEVGFSLRVAYQLHYVFRIQIMPFNYKPHGFLAGTYDTKVNVLVKRVNDEDGYEPR